MVATSDILAPEWLPLFAEARRGPRSPRRAVVRRGTAAPGAAPAAPCWPPNALRRCGAVALCLMSCGAVTVVVAHNAFGLCCAVLRCVCRCGIQGKAHALHSTICQHALSIVSTVRPALRAIHRQHSRIATSLLVASGDAVSEALLCV